MAKPGDGSSLAERFRMALTSEAAAKEAAAAAAARQVEQALRAQDALVDELIAFAGAIGVVQGVKSASGLELSRDGKAVRLARADAGSFQVSWADGQAVLYREAQLGERWVLVIPRRGRDLRLPLFDQGLEELLVLGLGLPRPT
jgi:hypothetical protein